MRSTSSGFMKRASATVTPISGACRCPIALQHLLGFGVEVLGLNLEI